MKEFEDTSISQMQKKKSIVSVVGGVLIVVSLLFFGAVGGVGGILLLSAKDNTLAKKLGIDTSKISIPTTKTEKIVVEESNAIIDTTNKISPSVVSILLKSQSTDIFGQTVQSTGAGTGFIITSDGLILTNKHVAADLTAAYTVVTSDGKTYDAKVQSQDTFSDLAVLKIDARNLPVVELGDSDQLKVGQWVIAVGNALGQFQNTVTAGVVSAKNRSITASDSAGSSSEALTNLLQTDAAINPGNSGGPLVNLAGQVVGINTATASGAQGIGFAIPINDAKKAIDSIRTSGRIIRPYLGVRYVELSKVISDKYGLPVSAGAWVKNGSTVFEAAVVPGSPADKAGIVENDIVTEINGTKIDENNSLISLVQKYNVGDEITLKVLSKGVEKTVKVKLEESK
ncbi:MAG: trypsin-like peptidase domain-containing protein [Candidatus Berkelbacteria bacterium]